MRIKNIKHNAKGLTLLELIISIGLGTFLMMMVGGTMASGLKNMAVLRSREHLHANAVFLSDTFSYLVKQGISITVPDPSTLQIAAAGGSPNIVITKNGAVVLRNGSPLTTGDVRVTELVFTKMAKSVRVHFSLEAFNIHETISATTTIAQRNIN